MKVLPFLLAALFACAPAGRAQPGPARADAWSRYTYPGEEFSVELPEMPLVFHARRQVRDTPYESEKLRVFGIYSGGVVYMIIAFDRPRSSESDEQFTGYVWRGRGLTPAGEVRPGGTKGREYDIALGFKGRARLFRTKGHAYLIKAFADAGGREASIERFLNSFTLGAGPPGEMIADDPPAGAGTPKPGPPAGEAGGPYKTAEVGRKSVIVYKPEPGYTEEARRGNVTGVVRLTAVLSSSGKVTNISVVKGLPGGLTERAVTAARHILFFPAAKDGREVSQFVVLEYNFNIY